MFPFLSDFVYVMRFVCLIMCFGFVVVDVCVLPICVSGRVCFVCVGFVYSCLVAVCLLCLSLLFFACLFGCWGSAICCCGVVL